MDYLLGFGSHSDNYKAGLEVTGEGVVVREMLYKDGGGERRLRSINRVL